MTGKKILMVHKHFLPDTPPYASMLNDIAEALVKQLHDVTVYSAHPSYKSNKVKVKSKALLDNGIKVKRIHLLAALFGIGKLKLLDMFYFPLRVFGHILSNNYDVVSVSTVPQVTLGWAAALACKMKRVKFIYHCMDIHPEIGAISGEFSNPVVFKLLRSMDNFTLKKANKVIVLSTDMANALTVRKYGKESNIAIINNFSLSSDNVEVEDSSVIEKYYKKTGRVRILFAGNIGRFQGLDNLVNSFNHLDDKTHLELVFLGEGKALKELQQAALHSNIIFLPHMPVSDAKKIMSNADFGIVSLQNEVINYAYPSKTLTYLEQGLPILALVENNTELSNMITANKLGYSIENSDVEGIKNILNKLNQNTARDVNVMSLAATEHYNNHFSKDKILTIWAELIKGM